MFRWRRQDTEEDDPNTVIKRHQGADNGKVQCYESEYFDSADPSSYDDFSEGSNADDANRLRSRDNYYDPMSPW